jgi:hypothetical protein
MRLKPILSFVIALVVCGITTPASAQAKINFDTSILSLIKTRCYKCHSASTKSPKAGLRLDGKYWILKGSKTQKVIVPGNSAKSELIRRISLPAGHKDVMPKKGTPLRPRQVKVFAKWVKDGADFGDWVGALAPGAKPAKPATPAVTAPSGGKTTARTPSFPSLQLLKKLGTGVSRPSAGAIKTATGAGAQVRPAQPNSSLWAVSYSANEVNITDANIVKLASLAPNLTDVNLAKTKITDASMGTIAKMTRLTRLNLSRTAITDAGLAKLKGLSELRYLNLYNTSVSDAGLKQLARLKHLEAIYVYQTKVTASGVAKLAKSLPKTRIIHTFAAPTVTPKDPDGGRKRRK